MKSPLHHHSPAHHVGGVLLQRAAAGFVAGAGFNVESPLVFGAGQGAVVQRGQRNVGALVAVKAIEYGESIVGICYDSYKSFGAADMVSKMAKIHNLEDMQMRYGSDCLDLQEM